MPVGEHDHFLNIPTSKAEVDPDQFSISVTTVDGQQFSIGDSDTQFCIQSCSKVISYLIALKQFGPEYVELVMK